MKLFSLTLHCGYGVIEPTVTKWIQFHFQLCDLLCKTGEFPNPLLVSKKGPMKIESVASNTQNRGAWVEDYRHTVKVSYVTIINLLSS